MSFLMTPGFRAKRTNRFMRSSGAEWIVGAISGFGAMVLLSLSARNEFPSVYHWLSAANLFAVLSYGFFGWWAVKSWRRLWRSGRTKPERIVYDYGVRFFGAILFIATPLIFAFVMFPDWNGVLLSMFLSIPSSLPICLWAGYAWGLLMGGAVSDDLPPPI